MEPDFFLAATFFFGRFFLDAPTRTESHHHYLPVGAGQQAQLRGVLPAVAQVAEGSSLAGLAPVPLVVPLPRVVRAATPLEASSWVAFLEG